MRASTGSVAAVLPSVHMLTEGGRAPALTSAYSARSSPNVVDRSANALCL